MLQLILDNYPALVVSALMGILLGALLFVLNAQINAPPVQLI
jgi:hypothetical protein